MLYSSLSELQLPFSRHDLLPQLLSQPQQTPKQVPRLATESIKMISLDRKHVRIKVINAILSRLSAASLDVNTITQTLRTQQLLFLDAPGGTRKTFVTTEIQSFLKF